MSSLMKSPMSSGEKPGAHSPWLSPAGVGEGLQVPSPALVLFSGCLKRRMVFLMALNSV